jgi:hypothetical protein
VRGIPSDAEILGEASNSAALEGVWKAAQWSREEIHKVTENMVTD